MSKVVTISKLEALLSRIRTRAAEPRPSGRAVVAAPAPAAPPPAVASPAFVAPPVVAPPPAAVAPPALAPPPPPPFVAPAAPAARAVREPSPQPPALIPVDEPTLPPPPLATASSDVDFDVDVDLTTGTPEPVAPVASEAQDARDSRERLSAAPPVPLEEPAAADGADVGPSMEQVDELVNEVNEGGIAGDEDEEIEETPASSRRPVTSPPEERLAELAFGAEEDQPARHTPPPKSGRLPAPPAVEFDADVTGVRAASLPSSDDATGPTSQVEPSALSAQAVRPNLASGTAVRVVDVIGEAQRFAPETFLALLDASLSL